MGSWLQGYGSHDLWPYAVYSYKPSSGHQISLWQMVQQLLLLAMAMLHRLIKDPNCKVTFFNEFCVFQDMILGRKIGDARVKNGLYLLEEIIASSIPRDRIFITQSSSLPRISKILLRHKRLGQPSFSTLQVLFSSLFEKVSGSVFQSEVCELAKPRPLSYQILL